MPRKSYFDDPMLAAWEQKALEKGFKTGEEAYPVLGRPVDSNGRRFRWERRAGNGRRYFKPMDIRRQNMRAVGGQRAANEKLATPPGVSLRQADAKMDELAAKGLVGHHNPPVSNVAKGIREVGGDVDPARRQLYFDRFESVGVPLGHNPDAIQPYTKDAHKAFHSKLEPALYGSIQRAGQETDAVFAPFMKGGAVRFPVKAAKFALGPASAVFTAGEAQARQQVAKEDPTLINKVKAAISTGEAALDAAGLASAATGIGAVATPFFEGGSMVLGFTNMVIEGSEDPAKISTKDRKRFRH